jgi:hypothetical protein
MRRLEMNMPMDLMMRFSVHFVVRMVVRMVLRVVVRMVVRFLMRMNVGEVFCDAHQIEVSVMYPAFGTNRIRQGRHNGGCSPEHHRLEAVLMVKLHVHGRDHNIMMIVLQTGKPLDQLALAEPIHVT